MNQRFHCVNSYRKVESTDVIRQALLHENVPKTEKCVKAGVIYIQVQIEN